MPNNVLPIWWQTEVNELFIRYWAVFPADGNRLNFCNIPQQLVHL
ncbi:hypothetical protein [Lacihabitans sp. LS3-19]|nr:hypothetical protein [Lacihabitans sp. LS3-19]